MNKDYTILKEIYSDPNAEEGEGRYRIHEGKYRLAKDTVAIKVFEAQKYTFGQNFKEMVPLLKRFATRNIVRIYDYWEEPEYNESYLVMEKGEKNLETYVHENFQKGLTDKITQEMLA